MYPTLISWGELRFHSYTVMMTLAFLIGALGPNFLNRHREKPFNISPAGGIWIFFAGIGGAKLWWVIQYGDASDWRYLQFFVTGGLVFFGGLLGGIVGGIAYLKYVKAPILPVADMVAPFMALAHGIGRVGCFLNGCCWGSLANFHIPWGACYPKAGYGPFREQVLEGLISSDAVQSLPVHPTQLYETIGCLIIFICLLVVYKKHKHAGVVTLTYLMLYGGQRFLTEMFRGDSARPLYGLTVSQIFGLSLFVFFGLLLLLLKKTLWKHSETAADGQEQEIPAAMVAKVSDGQTEEA